MHSKRKSTKKIYHWILTSLLFLLVSDNYLHYRGFPMAGRFEALVDRESLWKMCPGTGRGCEGSAVTTVRENLMRLSYERPGPKKYHALCSGCSYTFGVGVPDKSTYVWKLNEKNRDIEFDNCGIGGIGPLSAWMVTRRFLPQKRYDFVTYGLISDHLDRNSVPCNVMADKSYNTLGFFNNKITVNRADLYNEPIVELTPDFRFIYHWVWRYHFFADDVSPLSNFLNLYCKMISTKSMSIPNMMGRHIIMAHIINNQATTAAAYGCGYAVLALEGNVAYPELYSSKVNLINCQYYREFLPEDRVENNPNYHPNDKVHEYWSERITKSLNDPETFQRLLKRGNHRTLYDL